MGLFSLPTNLHFSQTWNLKFYPNSNEIKSGQRSRKDVRSFPFFSSKCFPPKIPLKLDATFFLFILFLFEILNFNYQPFHEFFKSRLKLSSFLSIFFQNSKFSVKSFLRLSQNVNKLINSAYSAQLAGDDKAARLSGLSNDQGRRKVWKSRGVDCDVVGIICPYWIE